MISLTYGVLPEEKEFCQRHPDPYPMSFPPGQDLDVIAETINIGIDSRLRAVFFTQKEHQGRLHIRINEPESLYTLLLRLVDLGNDVERDDEDESWENHYHDLACSILSTLNYEWV